MSPVSRVPSAANQLMRHFKPLARGRSVLKTGGVYRTVSAPSQDDVDAATEYYQGGRVHHVSQAVADALVAAGYTVAADAAAVSVESYEWRVVELGTWAGFAENHAWI